MRAQIEVRIIDQIRQGKWGMVTRPLSAIYAFCVKVRHWLYDRKWLHAKHAPLPVVSIGNLVAGGVGKTQVALLLAEALQDVAILSRGYRGEAEKGKSPFLVSPEQNSAQRCGDEPWLLASRLPKAHVIVHHNRYLSALEAEKLGARVLLLDDGMQHRSLFRDLEIVVLGGVDPFGGEAFLPRGFLREDPKRLAQADLVVFVGEPTPRVRERVSALTEAPCVVTQISVKGAYHLDGKKLPSLEGKKVGLFCGIGNPSRFVSSVENLGAVVVASHYLPDHKTMGKKELQTFADLCLQRGAECLLCTEKDKVKLPKYAAASLLPVGWVAVELEITRNRDAWDRITKEITLLAGLAR
ncbi:MAG: Tetraacyldisaccharide 4'-kinase [Chlamydiales bacterium]|nr:Tetraacyldisaccharide 4'-kinase [Chlamydiales bacterium]